MLLEELSSSKLQLLLKTLKQMGGNLGDWDKLPKFARNEAALEEAVHLYNWAIKSNGGSFREEYRLLSILVGARSMPGTRSTLRALAPSGFAGRNELVHFLERAASSDAPPSEFGAVRRDAMPFIQGVRHLFYTLVMLGKVATPGTQWHARHDGLNHSVAAATLKKLGVKGDNLLVDA